MYSAQPSPKLSVAQLSCSRWSSQSVGVHAGGCAGGCAGGAGGTDGGCGGGEGGDGSGGGGGKAGGAEGGGYAVRPPRAVPLTQPQHMSAATKSSSS